MRNNGAAERPAFSLAGHGDFWKRPALEGLPQRCLPPSAASPWPQNPGRARGLPISAIETAELTPCGPVSTSPPMLCWVLLRPSS